MRPSGDDYREMKASRFLSDDVIETIVRGDEVHPSHRPLAAFAEQLRSLGEGPVPPASHELAGLLYGREAVGEETIVAAGPGPGGRYGRRTGRSRPRLGPLAKVGIGTTLAVASATVAGAAGMLPAAANDAVRGAIALVSPVEFGQHHDESDDNFGSRVSPDATGESDGENGVDGQQISGETPGADHRSQGTSGQSGDTGLDRANQTPAAPNAPDATGTAQTGTQTGDEGNSPPVTPGDPDGDGQPGVTPVEGDPHGPPVTAPADTRIP